MAAILALMRDATAFLKEKDLSERSLFIARLALEEVLTNIVKYSYADEALHTIEVTAGVTDGRVALEFRDDGRPFDPLQEPAPKFGEPAQTQRLGGRGIHLVRIFATEVRYGREHERNVLTVGFPAQTG